MSALPRLLEDPSISEKLRADLQRAQSHTAAPFDTAAGLVRLRAGLKSGGGTMAPPAGGALPGASWKVYVALGVAGAIGWALLSGSSESSVRSAVSTPAAPAQPVTVQDSLSDSAKSVATHVDEPATMIEEPRDGAVPLSGPTVEGLAPVAKIAPSSVVRQKPDTFTDEISHLATLRKLYQTDPAGAASFAREGHKRFPQGVLYEEREALLILSLSQIGRSAEAERRAEDFQRRFPKSAFLSKMQKVVPVSKEPLGAPR